MIKITYINQVDSSIKEIDLNTINLENTHNFLIAIGYEYNKKADLYEKEDEIVIIND